MITKACVIFFTKDGKKYEIPCHRHGDAFYIISQFLPSNEIDKTKTLQGFYDENENFIDRYDAYEIAERCGQINRQTDLLFCRELYSEDLW